MKKSLAFLLAATSVATITTPILAISCGDKRNKENNDSKNKKDDIESKENKEFRAELAKLQEEIKNDNKLDTKSKEILNKIVEESKKDLEKLKTQEEFKKSISNLKDKLTKTKRTIVRKNSLAKVKLLLDEMVKREKEEAEKDAKYGISALDKKNKADKHKNISAYLTGALFDDSYNKLIDEIKTRVYRDSISGLDIHWNPRKDNEFKNSLMRKHNLLSNKLSELETKNNKEIDQIKEGHISYLNVLKLDLEKQKNKLEVEKEENTKKLTEINNKLEDLEAKEELKLSKSAIEDLKELIDYRKEVLKEYDNKIQEETKEYNQLLDLSTKQKTERDNAKKQLDELKETLESLNRKLKESDEKYTKILEDIEKELSDTKTKKSSIYKELDIIWKNLDHYNRNWMYTKANPSHYNPYTAKISELEKLLPSLKTKINDLIHKRKTTKLDKTKSSNEIKKVLELKNKELKKIEELFKDLDSTYNNSKTKLDKNRQNYENDKKAKELVSNELNKFEISLSKVLDKEKLLESEFKKHNEKKEALENRSKQIEEEIKKLSEKEKEIVNLEEKYEDIIQSLEKNAYNSELNLYNEIKQVEQELNNLK